MNNDIRISVSFRGHRKRVKLERILGAKATGYPLDLWLTVAQQRPDGHLKDWDEIDIALAAGYRRAPSKFVQALCNCGFLEKDGDGYRLHDWEDHQPWACGAEHRSAAARKAAMARWKGQYAKPNSEDKEYKMQGLTEV